jgi:hypothetical protein
VYVGVEDRGHLCLLYRADLAVGEHDEDRHILLSAQTVDGSRASVTTCCANDGQVLPVATCLVLVPADEEVFEEIAEELKGNVLEGECRAVEQLEQVDVPLLVECDSGCDVLGAECGVTAVDDVLQVGSGDLGRGDVAGEDLVCEFLEGQVLPLGRPVLGQCGDLLGDEQAAIRGKTLKDDFLKGELRQSVWMWIPWLAQCRVALTS